MSAVTLRQGWMAVAMTGVLALGLAACGGSDDSGSNSDAPIRIGSSLPLTGEFSKPGQAAEQGYQVWKAYGQRSRRHPGP